MVSRLRAGLGDHIDDNRVALARNRIEATEFRQQTFGDEVEARLEPSMLLKTKKILELSHLEFLAEAGVRVEEDLEQHAIQKCLTPFGLQPRRAGHKVDQVGIRSV
ncbi:hypothetical protein D9M72_600810 [compost metagenome]